MQRATSLKLYRYWNELRGHRLAPRRFEIEPSDIADLLCETIILEPTPANDDYRYRLAGTRVCEIFGQEFRGSGFLSDWQDPDRETLFRRLRLVRERGAVVNFEIHATTDTGRSLTLECLILPLIYTDHRIDRFLGTIGPIEAPTWLGEEPLTHLRLGTYEIIWPEVAPDHQPEIERAEEEPEQNMLTLPSLRHARIVRDNRRQFRVYDGGLAHLPAKPH